MARYVVKFGGTSVANPDRIREVASLVAREVALGHQICVVVSAMAGVTNQLVAWCRDLDPGHDPAEYDSVVASGENVTAGLTAIALRAIGVPAVSFQGWQIPLLTDQAHSKARIRQIPTERLLQEMSAGRVVVCAGFQGVTEGGRITTLGRGGSDTSAVALAAALQAERCDIYTDVDGVYTTDPRIVKKARRLKQVAYEEMLEMASLGAKVLQTRSVEMAMTHQVRVQVLSSFDGSIGSDLPGTLVVNEEEIMERAIVNSVTYAPNEARITLVGVPDRPGVAAAIFGPLAEAGINVDMIVQSVSPDNARTDMTFTIPRDDFDRARDLLESRREAIAYSRMQAERDVCKVSVIGIGMRSHAGVAQQMFQALAERGINIKVISTSEIKISVLIAAEYQELAVRALHTAYGLDG